MRDLQFRRRRFIISISAVALVFALTLVLSGLVVSFDAEVDRTLSILGADAYVINDQATGPFVGASLLPASKVEEVRSKPGYAGASPLLFRTLTIDSPQPRAAAVFGVEPGALGSPPLTDGRLMQNAGEAVVDGRLGFATGSRFTLSGTDLTVVGHTDRGTILGGTPDVFLSIGDLQRIGFGGAPIAGAVAVKGAPGSEPLEDVGLKVVTRPEAKKDLVRPLTPARDSITFLSILLWVIAVCIIGSVVYLSALERTRDFAVLKATGVANATVLGALVVQALVVSVGAALVATILGWLLTPLFPVPMDLPLSSVVFLPCAAAVAGCLASIAGIRRAIGVDPAIAFSGP